MLTQVPFSFPTFFFGLKDMSSLLSAVLLRSELHLVCHQHRQHWPERRFKSGRGNFSVPPPQRVHAGHRQPVERVGSRCQQPAEGDQHRHLCGAGLHPQTGRSLGSLTCSTPQHLCWWETTMQHYLRVSLAFFLPLFFNESWIFLNQLFLVPVQLIKWLPMISTCYFQWLPGRF